MREFLDNASHKALDWYINRQLPGWGRLQVMQYVMFCKPSIRSWMKDDDS